MVGQRSILRPASTSADEYEAYLSPTGGHTDGGNRV